MEASILSMENPPRLWTLFLWTLLRLPAPMRWARDICLAGLLLTTLLRLRLPRPIALAAFAIVPNILPAGVLPNEESLAFIPGIIRRNFSPVETGLLAYIADNIGTIGSPPTRRFL